MNDLIQIEISPTIARILVGELVKAPGVITKAFRHELDGAIRDTERGFMFCCDPIEATEKGAT